MTAQPEGKIDPRLLREGVAVLMLAGMASTAIEAQVVRWREELNVSLDWSFVGGRAIVRCFTDDYDRVAPHLHDFGVQVMPL